MSRNHENPETGRERAAEARRRRNHGWLVAVISVAALAVALVVVSRNAAHGAHHPHPRAAGEQPRVVPSGEFAQYPRVAESYAIAAAIPEILDGLHCYCDCAKHSGHYSLLDCFASDHGARCDICMSEAVIAYRMSRNGASLDEIRAELDRMYRT